MGPSFHRLSAAFVLVGAIASHAALQAGDLAFVAFNGNGPDNLAVVTFVDLPASTVLYFCDSEWSGTGFGSDEGDFTWNSGASVIPAGTVITIDSLGGNLTVSAGSITLDNSGGFSPSGDAMFVFTGTGPRTPTTILAAIGNTDASFVSGSGTVASAGLTLGSTAIVFNGMGIGQYKGTRTGLDKAGFLTLLNDASQWDLQASGNDNAHQDGIAPDLPFDTTPFVLSTTDNSAPSVSNASMTGASTIVLQFNEPISQATATNAANYSLSTGTVTQASLDGSETQVTLTVSGIGTGVEVTVSVSGIEDLAGNTLSDTWTSGSLSYNATTPQIVITEIMYNAPGDSSNALEFIELYNAGATPAAVGGLIVKDAGNFSFTLPDTTLAAGGILLLANDKVTADAFYGVPFLDLPSAGTTNALGNGGELLLIQNSAGVTIDSVNYDDAGDWPTAPDGQGASLELRDASADNSLGTNWAASTTATGKTTGGVAIFASPGSYSAVVVPQISFSKDYSVTAEDAGSAAIIVKLSAATTLPVQVRVKNLGLATAEHSFADTTLTFPAGSAADTLNIAIAPIVSGNPDTYFALELDSAVNAEIGSTRNHLAYIHTPEIAAPAATDSLGMQWIHSYTVDATGSAEIVAYHPGSKRLFVLNSTATKVMILDFSDPHHIVAVDTVDMSSHGIGATSVAVHGNYIAATVDAGPEANGSVVLMDTNGTVESIVEVGNLPDMVTFSPDGKWVLTANEGQPKSDYTVDAEGSVSLIDISSGITGIDASDVTTIGFQAFNSKKDSLTALGLRVFGVKGGASTLAEDVEPEYITVSADSKTAWVSLQENNAIATINLETKAVTRILPLGFKDHSLAGNEFDASDKTSSVLLANWPVSGMYMPDAIANFPVGGTTYVVSANEGDAREYDAFEEEAKVGDADYVLDPTVFPNAAVLKSDKALGRLAVTKATGDIDGDGDYDRICAFGARSFSIWNAGTGALVYDSKSDFERITAADPTWGSLFNASNDNNNFKNRSDNKGPEPEGIALGSIRGRTYAFIALERTGGVMAYDISDPNSPVFVSYVNSRSTGSVGGDLGPEGIIFIPASESPNDTALVVAANEISATISIYSLNDHLDTPVSFPTATFSNSISVQVRANTIFFSRPVQADVYSLTGSLVLSRQSAAWISLESLPKGSYLVRLENGQSLNVQKN